MADEKVLFDININDKQIANSLMNIIKMLDQMKQKTSGYLKYKVTFSKGVANLTQVARVPPGISGGASEAL